ncbi:tetratricopeptide repeat-containing hybrid sensor histidine kinase/response regulator [Lacinutrix mariniflava]|uniref:tetratricopeptide repeat-containing hybrid sensor histidine kinase/response regulator n=1 Tax=Lacinutrix mariniflava TaxID=342955 RepID=UPI0006E323FB|nr:ATP-binding protein [Lacinutrix mariniflava]
MTINNLQKTNEVHVLLSNAYSGRTSNLLESIVLAKKALSISKFLENKSLIGKSLNQLSLYYMINSDFKKSKIHSQEAIIYFKAIGDERGVADAKYTIGSINYKTDNYHQGLIHLKESLRLYKKFADFESQSKVEKAIGAIYEYIGDQENAFSSYKCAVRNARKVKNLNLESNAFNNLSGLLLKKQKPSIAMKMIAYAIKLKKQTGDTRGLAFAIYGRGKIYLKLGEFKNAEIDFLDAIDIHNKFVEIIGACMSYNKLGQVYYEAKQLKKAKKAVKEGLKLSHSYNILMSTIKGYLLMYRIYKGQDNIPKAFKYIELYLEKKEAVMDKQTQQVMENYNLINKMNVLESDALLQKERQKIINKKNQDKLKAVKVKQEFLSVMSHEIRTPLNAITTIVSILDDQLQGENKSLINSLQFASDNLINIVNNVLDYTKLDSKKESLELQSTNLFNLSTKILNLHLNIAKTKNLKLALDNNIPNNRNYLLDQTKLSQILNNLIANAIKFTDKGEVNFNLKLIKEDPEFDTIKISIKDTGEGITALDVKKIFLSFSQIRPVMTRKQGGTGLGLAIVKKLIELHDSKIQVKSKIQEGSEFYFTLKLKKSSGTLIEAKPVYLQLTNKTVLLAEDTIMNAILIKKVLSKWGVTTEHVVNGKLAVEASKKKKYDYILMDLHMPELNGIDATRLIRKPNNLNTATPIFAITADVMTCQNSETNQLFNKVLWKPIEIQKLYAALAEKT